MSLIDIIKAILGTAFIGFSVFHVNEYLRLRRRDKIKRVYDDIKKQKEDIRTDIENKSIEDLLSSSRDLANKVRSRRRL